MYTCAKKRAFCAVAGLLCVLACVLSACQKPAFQSGEALAFLNRHQTEIERIRESYRQQYAKIGMESVQMMMKKGKPESREVFDQMKRQAEIRKRVIFANILKYQVDLDLLRYVNPIQDDVRRALAALRKEKIDRPDPLSAYLKDTEFEEFETDTANMLKRDNEKLAFWKAELEKWEQSWELDHFDYNPPEIKRDVFRFDYDNQPQLLNSLKQVLKPKSTAPASSKEKDASTEAPQTPPAK